MLVLGIESSCDDSAAAVLRDDALLASVVTSQDAVHGPYGGVVPELASRHHVRNLLPVIDAALARAAVTLDDVDGIAVTCGPGLVGSLLVGLNVAKGIAQRRRLPLVGVNHLEGHLLAVDLAPGRTEPVPAPYWRCSCRAGTPASTWRVAMLTTRASGARATTPSGRPSTRPPSCSDSDIRVGRRSSGRPPAAIRAVRLPRAHVKRGRWDFSFSGFKTALREHVARAAPSPGDLPDLAASIQEGLVGMLVDTSIEALEATGVERMVVSGGVAANARLRARLTDEAAAIGVEVLFPPPSLCTDNAAMIARAGRPRLARGESDTLDIGADADLPFGVPWSG